MILAQVLLSVPALIQPVPLQSGTWFTELAILFVILAVVAATLGASGVAGINMRIAKWFVVIFLGVAFILFVA